MGGKNKSPDYSGAAKQQGEDNREVNTAQTFANRPNQVTPYGESSWTPYQTIDPGTGKSVTAWKQNLNFNPVQQSLFDQQNRISGMRGDVGENVAGRLQSEFGKSMDWSGLSPMGGQVDPRYTKALGSIGDPNKFRQKAEDARYNKASSRLSPQYAEKRRAMETQLRNQGLSPEDSAWKTQMAGIDTAETDAYAQAQYDAVTGGMGEANQMYNQLMGNNQNMFNQSLKSNQQNYGMDQSSSEYANQLRQQQIAEMMQQRGFSLNELNAIMSGQQVGLPSMPSFSDASRAEAAPTYQAGVDQGNFNQAQNQQTMDAVTGGAQAAMMFSDRRLKRNVKRLGTVNGHKWYSFDYIWGVSAQGVMADEVPESYTATVGGYAVVDYSKVLGV